MGGTQEKIWAKNVSENRTIPKTCWLRSICDRPVPLKPTIHYMFIFKMKKLKIEKLKKLKLRKISQKKKVSVREERETDNGLLWVYTIHTLLMDKYVASVLD